MTTGSRYRGDTTSVTSYLQELFQLRLYKKSQGRNARQVTLIAIAAVAAMGAWSLRGWMQGEGASTASLNAVPLAALGASIWAAFRLIQLPKFADFLISVEAEMNKVSWPTRSELIRASAVVIFVIFFLAGLLFFYDWFLKGLLSGAFYQSIMSLFQS